MRWPKSRKLARAIKLVERSGLFDERFYRAQERCSPGSDPVDHYLTAGWRQGLDPGPAFSTLRYLSQNPDVEDAGINPLVHYLEHGLGEGRNGGPQGHLAGPAGEKALPCAPSPAEWSDLAEAYAPPAAVQVNVLVPVYRGYSETLRCLYSVLRARQSVGYRLVVVYDHGPDAELRRVLGELAGRGLITLLETPRNVGFVRACNLGLAFDRSTDVVLLNSDTEVYGDWLDRLRQAAYGAPRVATVTPLSNNAEICSYPRFITNNDTEVECGDAELDRLAARANADAVVDIPTGVGFCMYVRRAALDEVGLLAEEHFGRGYGEENDLCRRASAAGWRNLLAGNVFVRHYGGRSFGPEKQKLVETAIRTVERLHPGYLAQIHLFITRDPVGPIREALDRARLRHRLGGREAILFVTHALGGGTERHVRELAARLEDEGTPVLVCRPHGEDGRTLAISDPRTRELPNLPRFDLGAGPSAFAAFLADLNVVHVHVHQVVGYAGPIVEFLRQACRIMRRSYDVTLHDYTYICPRITLIGEAGHYCGEPSLAHCERCVRTERACAHGASGVWEWREQSARLLNGARKVFAPSRDTARRYGRYVPEREFLVRPHFGSDRQVPARSGRGAGPRTIAVIGAIGPHKGSALIQTCAEIARLMAPELRFEIIGYTDRDEVLRGIGNVAITGAYEDDELAARLAGCEATVAWFPAVWPETFSYTLSGALEAGLMPLAFDFGAIAERVREVGWGVLLPPVLMLQPRRLVEELLAVAALPPPATIRTGVAYESMVRDYYAAPNGFPVNGSA